MVDINRKGRGDVVISIEGLPELRRALRRLSRDAQKSLDKELKAAARPIAADAKKRYRKFHPRRRGGKGSQRGIRAGFRGGKPTLTIGSARYPYLQGQEWGAKRYPQFPPWIPAPYIGSVGRFFWPAIIDGSDEAEQKILAAIDRSISQNFPAAFGATETATSAITRGLERVGGGR